MKKIFFFMAISFVFWITSMTLVQATQAAAQEQTMVVDVQSSSTMEVAYDNDAKVSTSMYSSSSVCEELAHDLVSSA